MKDTDYPNLVELTPVGGGFLPVNQRADELIQESSPGEVLAFQEVTGRDLKFHRAYFSLINYIWAWLPKEFKKQIPEDKFYKFLKHLRKEYDVVMTFKDGSQIVEYKSISFGKMSQVKFKEYVRNQLPYIYIDVIEPLYQDKKTCDKIIASIESEYKKFLSKL